MVTRHIRSTDGNDADDGSTWLLAKATLAGVAAIDTAGDRLCVSQAHAESTAAAINIALAGTAASPSWLMCVDDGASPPTALAATATVTTTGNSDINIGGSNTFGYVHGLSFIAGSGASGLARIIVNGGYRFTNCNFTIATTSSSAHMAIPNTGNISEFIDCGFKFSAAGQYAGGSGGTCMGCIIRGGGLMPGTTSPTACFSSINGTYLIDGFDFSNGASSINLVGSVVSATKVQFRNCRLPASWSGVLWATVSTHAASVEMFNCDSADTNYRYRKTTYPGTIRDETTNVRAGGASDGTTPISHKMVTTANAEYPALTLNSPEIVAWNEVVGSAITATVEILRDSATALKNDEVWLEVMYLGTSGVPLGSFISDAPSDVLATPADQDTSSETWTTTGMANPNKQKLSVTFTPQEVGHLHCVVKCAKASTTLYYDPMVTVA